MYLRDSEKKKVNSGAVGVYEKVLLKEEEEEEKLVSSFDRDIESILGKDFVAYLAKNNYIKVKTENGRVIGVNVLRDFHYTDIPSNVMLSVNGKRISASLLYRKRVAKFFSKKTEEYRQELKGDIDGKKMERNMPKCFALASIGLTTFHRRKGMVLRDVQKIAGMGMCYGDIAELGTGEGKTIAAVLPAYMHALRGKGVHVVTANNYLSRRDFEELRPVYEGLGLTCGYVRSQEEKIDDDKDELKVSKRKAYAADITYGAKDEIAFDYLRDSTAYALEDVVTRDGQPGFAIVDEVDDALVDSASSPYVIAGTPPYYRDGMTLTELATALSIPLDKVIEQLKLRGMDTDLSKAYGYEEATRVAELFSKELYRDHHHELNISQLFYEMIRNAKVTITPDDKPVFDKYKDILEMENGILRVKDVRLFQLLARSMTSDDSAYYYGKYKFTIEEIDTLRRYTKIIVCPTSKDFYVTDKTLEEHLNLQFLNSPKVKKYVEKYQHKLMMVLTPPEDYSMSKNNTLRLTMKGFMRLCEDESLKPLFPQFQSIYSELINNRNTQGSFYMHILYQTILANELQVKGEDYIVRDGQVILLRNAREREGSSYSNGLHQAIEVKEALRSGARQTNEHPSLASVTQKDFYSRYELFCGMTGTSAHKIFAERYGKQTLEVPRDSFYAFYSSKLRKQKRNTTKEPRGVEKKKAVFAHNRNDKFELIYKSIMESHKTDPRQPVLIVVSDPKEIGLLQEFLKSKGINPNVIETTRLGEDKRKNEAMMVAMAGVSGTVTIATEMAGRGTDIKIGGDRDMLIDIATDRLMKTNNLPESSRDDARKVCEEQLIKLGRIPTKEKEARDREKLADVGLKVISSGFFNSKRIDRQLEGRTGRNGYSGVTERYSSIEDLTHLGIERVEQEPLHRLFARATRNPDGSIVFKSKDYTALLRGIEIIQNAYDESISNSLQFSEDITRYTTEVMDNLRSKRRHLLELTQDDEKLKENADYVIEETEKMIRNSVDSLITSYIVNKDVSEYGEKDNKEKLDINYEGLALAVKETLGIELNIESIRRSNVSVYELREALLNLALKIHRDGLAEDRDKQLKQDINALLTASNNSLSRIHEREEFVRRQKALDQMTRSESADNIAIMSISEMLYSLEFESSRAGARLLMGVVLSKEEKDKLDAQKKKMFDYRIVGEDTYEPLSQEDDYKAIREMRKDRSSRDRGYVSERERADKKADKETRKNKEADVSRFYSNLQLRPLVFVLGSDGTFILKKGYPQRQNLSDSKKSI